MASDVMSPKPRLRASSRQANQPYDELDRQIIGLLQQDGRRPNTEIAHQLGVTETTVRKRIGRWLERYPDVARRIDRDLKVADLVEAVFLAAFEGHERRPMDLRYGDWLESLIDPAVKRLGKDGDRELENINLLRTAVEAEGGPKVG